MKRFQLFLRILNPNDTNNEINKSQDRNILYLKIYSNWKYDLTNTEVLKHAIYLLQVSFYFLLFLHFV